MLWKFSFSGSVSTLDTLLSRESPPSVEELLDEQDILAECKAQNNKCVYRPEGERLGSAEELAMLTTDSSLTCPGKRASSRSSDG